LDDLWFVRCDLVLSVGGSSGFAKTVIHSLGLHKGVGICASCRQPVPWRTLSLSLPSECLAHCVTSTAIGW
jgi:hypothetical protein